MNKRALIAVVLISVLTAGCGTKAPETVTTAATEAVTDAVAESTQTTTQTETTTAAETTATTEPDKQISTEDIVYLKRPTLLESYSSSEITVEPKVTYQEAKADLSNVYFGNHWLNDEEKELLAKNGFYLSSDVFSYDPREFFGTYEMNRYNERASYVTVDSMMHTYHLYFSHLLKKVEQEHLVNDMLDVSKAMLDKAQSQYDKLAGTEWEKAAKTELAFFTVGASLIDPAAAVPKAVKDEVAAELDLISKQDGIYSSNIFEDKMEDYSQYKPRGYYDSSEDLQKYFRAMMWYGRMGFRSDDETANRAALLITLALDGDTLSRWEKVYSVTSFFAGESDDLGYYELRPLIDAVYGENITEADLIGKNELWEKYHALCAELPSPAINSVPVYIFESDEEQKAAQKGYRFMGQRFSIDEAVFTQLVYRQVKARDENDPSTRRMLPDTLDIAAAFGSDTAMKILEDEGKTDYPNFDEQMEKVRLMMSEMPQSSWTANLYSAWIYTIMPMTQEKDEAYPPVTRTEGWKRRALMSFAGSYAELKHDTILYSKQIMAEMGGGGEWDPPDDRGYVEAEPVVFARLEALINATKQGLDGYGMLADSDKEDLEILGQLAGKLKTISEKELNGELPTDEEFDLIRSYGGQLEHFWQKVMDSEYPDEEYHSTQEHPAAVIADIATDPDNGKCLEVGIGNPLDIVVLVEVDGVLKVASGTTFSFYQFEQPIEDRLTDSEWRQKLGIEVTGEGVYDKDNSITYPEWYSDYLYEYKYTESSY